MDYGSLGQKNLRCHGALFVHLQGVVESLTAAAAPAANGGGSQQQAPAGVQARQLRATMATSNPSLQSTNLLHELDTAAQEVIAAIAAAQVRRFLDAACMQQ